MRKLILIIISAVSLLGTPAFAKDSGSSAWIVSQLSGDARVVHPGLQPVALKTAARLEPGDRIVTGLTGRATLTREADYIIVAPHSDLQLPVTAEPKGFTRVIQNLGTMLFKVRHTGIPHFTVDTPMLAAVVKGTTFTVVVGPDRSAVQVIEGAVQVTAADGGMSRLVEGGKTVFIDRLESKRLMDADERSPATTASSSTTAVKLVGSQTPSVATIAGLTEGLVQAGSTNSTAAATTTTPAAPLPDPSSTVANTTQLLVKSGSKPHEKPCKCHVECEGTCTYVVPQKLKVVAPQWVAMDIVAVLPLLAGESIETAPSWEAVSSPNDLAPPLRTHLLHQVLLN